MIDKTVVLVLAVIFVIAMAGVLSPIFFMSRNARYEPERAQSPTTVLGEEAGANIHTGTHNVLIGTPEYVQRHTQPQEMITCLPDGTGVGTGYRDFRADIKPLCGK